MSIKDLKNLSLEEFLKLEDSTEDLYIKLHNSKVGHITIQKISNNDGYLQKNEYFYGLTEAFGEGLSLIIDSMKRRYMTSTIQKINWNKKEFETLNSTYKFNFTEHGKNL